MFLLQVTLDRHCLAHTMPRSLKLIKTDWRALNLVLNRVKSKLSINIKNYLNSTEYNELTSFCIIVILHNRNLFKSFAFIKKHFYGNWMQWIEKRSLICSICCASTYKGVLKNRNKFKFPSSYDLTTISCCVITSYTH